MNKGARTGAPPQQLLETASMLFYGDGGIRVNGAEVVAGGRGA